MTRKMTGAKMIVSSPELIQGCVIRICLSRRRCPSDLNDECSTKHASNTCWWRHTNRRGAYAAEG